MKSYKENLSTEQIKNIVSDYSNIRNQTKVAKKYGISTKTVVKICKDNNVAIRGITKKSYCKECGKSLPKDCKFCPYCGKEIKSKIEYAVDNLNAYIENNGTIDIKKDWETIKTQLVLEDK